MKKRKKRYGLRVFITLSTITILSIVIGYIIVELNPEKFEVHIRPSAYKENAILK